MVGRRPWVLVATVVVVTSCGDAPAGGAGPVAPHFRDVTTASNVDFTHEVTIGGKFALPEIMGSGCAVFDANGDGMLDLYLVNAGVTRGQGAQDRLYLATGPGRYVDATAGSGIEDRGYGMGTAVGDMDNDGDLDLFVANWGTDQLYRNDGGGRFTDVTGASGIKGDHWASSAAFLDYDLDGWLDIFVACYVVFDPGRDCTQSQSRRDYCGPKVFRQEEDVLWRNRGDGTFEDVSARAGITGSPRAGLGVFVADFNDDGWPDVYVANDGEANNLWINQKDGTFVDGGITMGVALSGSGAAQAGMGVTVGDVDGDGDDEIFVTNQIAESNVLYRRDDPTGFSDATVEAGLWAPSRPHTGFGAVLFDADNDGDLDLAIANGFVEQATPLPGVALDPFWSRYADRNHLFLNDGRGRFLAATPAEAGGFGEAIEVSRGLAAADLDGDGDLDLIVTNDRGPARLYENRGASGHWLEVRAIDEARHRDAYGARVWVHAAQRVQSRTVGSAVSYQTSCDDFLHFGLGKAEVVDRIEVRWPGGDREVFDGGPADRKVVVRRGKGRAK